MSIVLETKALSKNYGRIEAAKQISLQIPEGSVFGILGPNGSGKSTTLGMVLGAIRQTSGSFSWFGQGEDHLVRREIGAILERPIFYPAYTAMQNLRITASIKNVDHHAIDRSLKLVGLYDRRNSSFRTYSLGMKQRLAIASAMLCDPKVLVLDEPTNGLDPQGIAEIRNIITNIAKTGKTIILASHLLDEVQRVCTDFCVLRKGELIFQGKVSDTGEELQPEVEVKSAASDLANALHTIEFVEMVNEQDVGRYRVVLKRGWNAANLNKSLFEKGVVAEELITHRRTLEEKFLEILKQHK